MLPISIIANVTMSTFQGGSPDSTQFIGSNPHLNSTMMQQEKMKCPYCPNREGTSKEIEDHLDFVHEAARFSCGICEDIYLRLRSTTSVIEKPKRFDSIFAMRTHLKSFHKIELTSKDADNIVDPLTILPNRQKMVTQDCHWCKFKFHGLSQADLKQHFIAVHNCQFVPRDLKRICRICDASFESDDQAGDHINQTHPRENYWPDTNTANLFGAELKSKISNEIDKNSKPIPTSGVTKEIIDDDDVIVLDSSIENATVDKEHEVSKENSSSSSDEQISRSKINFSRGLRKSSLSSDDECFKSKERHHKSSAQFSYKSASQEKNIKHKRKSSSSSDGRHSKSREKHQSSKRRYETSSEDSSQRLTKMKRKQYSSSDDQGLRLQEIHHRNRDKNSSFSKDRNSRSQEKHHRNKDKSYSSSDDQDSRSQEKHHRNKDKSYSSSDDQDSRAREKHHRNKDKRYSSSDDQDLRSREIHHRNRDKNSSFSKDRNSRSQEKHDRNKYKSYSSSDDEDSRSQEKHDRNINKSYSSSDDQDSQSRGNNHRNQDKNYSSSDDHNSRSRGKHHRNKDKIYSSSDDEDSRSQEKHNRKRNKSYSSSDDDEDLKSKEKQHRNTNKSYSSSDDQDLRLQEKHDRNINKCYSRKDGKPHFTCSPERFMRDTSSLASSRALPTNNFKQLGSQSNKKYRKRSSSRRSSSGRTNRVQMLDGVKNDFCEICNVPIGFMGAARHIQTILHRENVRKKELKGRCSVCFKTVYDAKKHMIDNHKWGYNVDADLMEISSDTSTMM